MADSTPSTQAPVPQVSPANDADLRLTVALIQKQLDALTKSGSGSSAPWLPSIVTGMTVASLVLGFWISMGGSMNEVVKANREISVQLAVVDTRVDGLEKRLDKFEPRFDRFEQRSNDLDKRLDEFRADTKSSFEKTDTRLKGIEDVLVKSREVVKALNPSRAFLFRGRRQT